MKDKSRPMRLILALTFLALLTAGGILRRAGAQQESTDPVVAGYSDTPTLPGQPWRVHDGKRPKPPVVIPGESCAFEKPAAPPSDAVVLFDGKDLSRWGHMGRDGKLSEARWKLGDGYFEVLPGAGDLVTRESFGDCQLHIEWASPAEIRGAGQNRGNSGVILMKRYEIQVLDSWNSPTYADGQAGAIYGQWPPLVNASRRPGQWQVYDIVFEAPRFDDGGKLIKPAYFTVFHNGVVLHNRKEVMGAMVHRRVAVYAPHPAEEPLLLQDHKTPVRYRNVWIRRLKGYDQL